MLWVDVLVVGTSRLAMFLGSPEGRFSESCGASSSRRYRTRGCLCESRGFNDAAREFYASRCLRRFLEPRSTRLSTGSAACTESMALRQTSLEIVEMAIDMVLGLT
ncbi:hypothetical protein B296_00012268 [Ensete ventricosum]|uniref:Uncharacterized protein n=1 Tax=Ensete ventricosum TaxID=4639 RepID=A0A426Y997_ENSVE|nr:hypothetical protein B296_00012268 [Ensete ventricosum]